MDTQSEAIRITTYINGNHISYDSSYQSSLSGSIYIPSKYENSSGTFEIYAIGDYALQNFNLITEVTIQDGIKYIGSSAFEGCSNLTYIQIPNSVNSIGSYSLKTGNRNTKAVFTEGDNELTFSYSLHAIMYYYLRTTAPKFIPLSAAAIDGYGTKTYFNYPRFYVINDDIKNSINSVNAPKGKLSATKIISGGALSKFVDVYVLPARTPAITQTPQMTPMNTLQNTPYNTPKLTQRPTIQNTPEFTPKVTPDFTPDFTPEYTPELTQMPTLQNTPKLTPQITPKVTPKKKQIQTKIEYKPWPIFLLIYALSGFAFLIGIFPSEVF